MRINTAGLIVDVTPQYDLLQSRALPYEYTGTRQADLVIRFPEGYYEARQKENPNLTMAECEYLWTSSAFYSELSRFGGMLLHASAVAYEGKAYLFSAPSGTGKSTHTHLWLRYLPGAYIINDDKPALRLLDGIWYAFGTPWSGKTDESDSRGVPIAGIAFLSRGEQNSIHRAAPEEVLKDFFDQTVRPAKRENMAELLESLDKLLTKIPIYRFSCNRSEDAVKTALCAMRAGANKEDSHET